MRILLITETLHVGGAETFVVRLANSLSAVGHKVAVAVFFDTIVNENLYNQFSDAIEIHLINTPVLSIRHKVDSLLFKLGIDYNNTYAYIQVALGKIIQDFLPDVVHTNLFKTDWVVTHLRKKGTYTFRHITTIHGDYSSFYNGEASAKLQNIREKIRHSLALMHTIVCLCEEHEQFFLTHYPKETQGKLQIVYNGYKPPNDHYMTRQRKDLGLPEGHFLFGMVSRGVEKKGWKNAVEAFLMADLPKDSSLVLVGQGPYLDELKQQISNPRILFAGFSPIPLEYIQHFDVCMLPTLFSYESLPTVVMEYLYCGKPVIATDVGEIRKMISDDKGNIAGRMLDFVDQQIEETQFVAAMESVCSSKENNPFEGIAQAAFQKFDMATCTQHYLNIYQQV